MPVHPLDLIRIDIRRIHLHRGGEVDDHGVFPRRSPGLLYRSADFQCKIQLRSGKTFRRILQNDFSGEVLRMLLHHLRPVHGDLDDLLLRRVENHIPLQGGGGIINMHHRLLTSLNGLKSPVDQLFSALG